MIIKKSRETRLWLRCLLLVMAVAFSSQCVAWWDTNWPYRAQIVLTNSSGSNVTNQAFDIKLNAANLHPAYSTWTTAGDDVRIYEANDSTPINFFISGWNATTKIAHIVIRTSLNAGQSKTIYMYYGNTSASSASNYIAVLTEVGLRFHTRLGPFTPGVNPGLTLAQTEAAFDAIADSAGYGCAPVTAFTNIRNSGPPINGSASNIFFRAEHWFYVDTSDVGEWRFEYSGDYGDGGVLYLDGVERHERWGEDLWWANSWANTNEILRTSGVDNNSDTGSHPNLGVGWHVLKFFGSEQCCDGGTSVRFRKPSNPGVWMDWTTTNHALIRSPGCTLSSLTSTVRPPRLVTSTKTGVDINGAPLLPNETIRYTITLNETNTQQAGRISFTDDMTLQATNTISLVSLPSGALATIVGEALSLAGIEILTGGNASVVYDVIVDGTATPGTNINNSYTYSSPGGDSTLYQGTINANTLTVYTPSASVTKQLYLYNTSDTLRRVRDTVMNDVTIAGANGTRSWTLTPALASSLTVGSTITVRLLMARTPLSNNRSYTLRLWSGATPITSVNTSTSVTLADAPTNRDHTLTVTNTSIASGSPITLTLVNTTTQAGRSIIVRDIAANNSTTSSVVEIPALTYIDVTNVTVYSDAGGVNAITEATAGDTVYVRATVTDPFGFADITGINFNITNATPALQATYNETSPQVTVISASGATKVYQLQYNIPAFPVFGNWVFLATAEEGYENTVTDSASKTVRIKALPAINVLKSASATTARPLLDVISYTITLTNSGSGDAHDVIMTDTLSPYLAIRTQYNGTEPSPFFCVAGCGTSGLSFTPVSVQYNDSLNTWLHALNSGAGGAPTGYDGAVTQWRIPLSGILNNTNVIAPATNVYSLQYQALVK